MILAFLGSLISILKEKLDPTTKLIAYRELQTSPLTFSDDRLLHLPTVFINGIKDRLPAEMY